VYDIRYGGVYNVHKGKNGSLSLGLANVKIKKIMEKNPATVDSKKWKESY